jgi:hypothetical protein
VMQQAPTAAACYSPFIRTIFADLDPSEREIVTLYTIHLEGGVFQWAQHRHLAPNFLGVSTEQVDAIAADDVDGPIFSERHRALMAFTRKVVKEVRVDDESFAAVARHFSDRHIIEILFTIGNYMLLCRISEVCLIPPEPPETGVASLTNALAANVRDRPGASRGAAAGWNAITIERRRARGRPRQSVSRSDRSGRHPLRREGADRREAAPSLR